MNLIILTMLYILRNSIINEIVKVTNPDVYLNILQLNTKYT